LTLSDGVITYHLHHETVLEACEQDFFQEIEGMQEAPDDSGESKIMDALTESECFPALDVHDVLAEVNRMFEERKE